ncbi:MAG: SDR family oxidoreductase [Micromonosporaceae bacterium]|nr:SDR family oxidoreductase [Micromonosporaceae bacterium]
MTQQQTDGDGAVVVIGGTAGLGRDLAEYYAARGRRVVITGRGQERADKVAAEVGGNTSGIGLDLTKVDEIAPALASVGPVQYLVLSAFFRDRNTAKDFNIANARDLATIKIVGYTEVVHALYDRLQPTGSVLIYGGGLKDRPQVGTLTVSTTNAAVMGLTRALAVELAPIRVNAIHPGMVADSPFWSAQPAEVREAIRSRTPTKRFTTMRDVTTAAVFLLEHPAINGVNLDVNGGASLT